DRGIAASAPMAAGPAQGVPQMVRATVRSPRAALARCGDRLVPEWPDLHVVRDRLEKALVGREITLVRVGAPLVLRSARPVDAARGAQPSTGPDLPGRDRERLRRRDSVGSEASPKATGGHALRRGDVALLPRAEGRHRAWRITGGRASAA